MSDYSFDLYRIFLGEHPFTFFFEIVLRVCLVYSVTLLFLRWTGKRTLGEFTFFDFAIIIALGSAVGDGMIFDDVPLLHSFAVVACVMGLERLVAIMTEKNETLEKLVESEPTLIIENGVILLDKLHEETLSQDELFESLRYDGIHQLGQIALAYLEPSGKVSVIKCVEERPGLSVLPDGRRLRDSTDQQILCCCKCGCLAQQQETQCSRCNGHDWQPATLTDCSNTPKSIEPSNLPA